MRELADLLDRFDAMWGKLTAAELEADQDAHQAKAA